MLLVEQSVRPDWKLVQPEKPAERSRDVNRFQVTVQPGKGDKLTVVEERSNEEAFAVTSVNDEQLSLYLSGPVPGPAVKNALARALTLRSAVSKSQLSLGQYTGELSAITSEQERLRANLKTLPSSSAAYKRYLLKFDVQETEIERLQAKIKQSEGEVKEKQAEYETFLAELRVE